MKRLLINILAIIFLIVFLWIIWKLKWLILFGSIVIVLSAMAYEKATGKRVAFLHR